MGHSKKYVDKILTIFDKTWQFVNILTTPFWQRNFWMALKTSLTLGLGLRLNLSRKLLSTFYEIFKLFQKIWLHTILSMKKQFISAIRISFYLRRISDHSLQTDYVSSKNFLLSFPPMNKKIHTSFKSLYLPGLYPPKSRRKSYPKF